jgi:hypothetical protein
VFVKHISLTQVSRQSVTKLIGTIAVNLVTPTAATKLELLFNELDSEKCEKIRCVCETSKSDSTITTKSDQIHLNDCCEFGHI